MINVLKQALAAMEYSEGGWAVFNPHIMALRSAIEQLEKAEPVAWVDERAIAWLTTHPRGKITTVLETQKSFEHPMPLYAAPVIPEGWKLVPLEATLDMWNAASTVGHNDDAETECNQMWAAMLAAVPEYKP